VEKHSEYGYELLKNQNVSVRIKKIALTHHERCDGSGYPIGLIGDDIDDFANIVAIADVYDAMTQAPWLVNDFRWNFTFSYIV